MIANSIVPMSSPSAMATATLRGIKNLDMELEYIKYRRKMCARFSTCVSAVGVMFSLAQVLTTVIWDSNNGNTVRLTLTCISLLLILAIYLSTIAPEIRKTCGSFMQLGVILYVVIVIYAMDAVYNNSDFTLQWTLVLAWITFGCIDFPFKVRFFVLFVIMCPNAALSDDCSRYGSLDGTLLYKILKCVLLSIPISWLGFTLFMNIDTKLRQAFTELRHSRTGNKSAIQQLKGREKSLYSAISCKLGSEMLTDIRREGKIPEGKLYSCSYTNVSILVISLRNLEDCYNDQHAKLSNILNDVFMAFDSLSEGYRQIIMKMFHNGFVFVSEEDCGGNNNYLSVCMGLEMIDKVSWISSKYELQVSCQIGIHRGNVFTSVLGQNPMQLDVSGKDFIIADKLHELGDSNTIHCSQAVQSSIRNQFDCKENVYMNKDSFLQSNGIKSYRVARKNSMRQINVHKRCHPTYTGLSTISSMVYEKRPTKQFSNIIWKCRSQRQINLLSLLSAPVVLLSQLSLYLLYRPLIVSEAVLFSIGISVLVLIPGITVYRTRRKTSLQFYKVLTLPLISRCFTIVYPISVTCLILMCTVITTLFNDSTTETFAPNVTVCSDVRVQSRNVALALVAISSLVIDHVITCLCILVSLIAFCAVDTTVYVDRSVDVLKAVIHLTGLALSVLNFQHVINNILCKIGTETALIEEERKLVLNEERQIKHLEQNIYHVRLQQEILHMETSQQGTSFLSYSNVGIMVVTWPTIIETFATSSKHPVDFIRLLQKVLLNFDQLLLTEKFTALVKITGSHSQFIVASGISKSDRSEIKENHLKTLLSFATSMKETVKSFSDPLVGDIALRIGIHCGPVKAGFIGTPGLHFEIWGTTMDVAMRLERSGKIGSIQVSEEFAKSQEKTYNFYEEDCVIGPSYFVQTYIFDEFATNK